MQTSQQSKRILVVDDDRQVRAALAEILEFYGYAVVQAENGERALEKAFTEPGPIDLIITDIVMPGMNVEEMARQLLERHPLARLIAISGYDARGTAKVLQSTFGAEFFPKPLSLAVLMTAVRRILGTS